MIQDNNVEKVVEHESPAEAVEIAKAVRETPLSDMTHKTIFCAGQAARRKAKKDPKNRKIISKGAQGVRRQICQCRARDDNSRKRKRG